MTRPELERRTAQFARQVFALCIDIRAENGGPQVANQLQAAATSAGANYRASGRARSRAEFIAKLGIANEEIDEAVYWLELCTATELVEELTVRPLVAEARELRAILARSYATARKRNRK